MPGLVGRVVSFEIFTGLGDYKKKFLTIAIKNLENVWMALPVDPAFSCVKKEEVEGGRGKRRKMMKRRGNWRRRRRRRERRRRENWKRKRRRERKEEWEGEEEGEGIEVGRKGRGATMTGIYRLNLDL